MALDYREETRLLEEVEEYIVDYYDLKGSVFQAAEGLMNGSLGTLSELHYIYSSEGVAAAAQYIVDTNVETSRRKYLR